MVAILTPQFNFGFEMAKAAGDFYADTGSAADIQNAVDGAEAAGGGTVHIPEGTFYWEAGDTVTYTGAEDINITGNSRAGCKGHGDNWEKYTATTIIHSNDVPPMSNRMFKFGGQGHNPLVYGSVKVSNIQFEATPPANPSEEAEGQNAHCAIYIQQIPDFRVSYCTFIDFCEKAIGITSNDGDGSGANVSSFGLVDHCYITQPYKLDDPAPGQWYYGYGIHVVGENHLFSNDEPWWDGTATDYFGKYGYRRWFSIAYIEDNHIEYSRHHISSMGRGYYVARFNLFDHHACGYQAGMVDVHGADFPGGRGGEYYNNTMIGYPDNKKPWPPYPVADSIAFQLRGGHHLVYDNDFTCDTYRSSSYLFKLENDRGKTGTTYQYQFLNYSYFWDNSYTNSSFLQNTDPTYIHEDLEYFLREPTIGQDGFEYTAYTYPHPLIVEEEDTWWGDWWDNSWGGWWIIPILALALYEILRKLKNPVLQISVLVIIEDLALRILPITICLIFIPWIPLWAIFIVSIVFDAILHSINRKSELPKRFGLAIVYNGMWYGVYWIGSFTHPILGFTFGIIVHIVIDVYWYKRTKS